MDNICIDTRSNICSICAKTFRHRIRYRREPDTPDGLKVAEHICSHSTCRNLLKKTKDLREQLMETEWQLFERFL